MNYYEPIEIIKFEKISDDIVHLGKSFVVRINVNLAKSFNGNRYFFYKEYEYSLGGYKRVSIKKSFDYYLSIEDAFKPKDRDKVFIRLGTGDYYAFINMLHKVIDWFTDSKFKKLYANNKGVLVIAAPTVPQERLENLPMGLNLTMNPTVIDTGNTFIPGIAVTVDDGKEFNVSTTMSIDNLFSVYGSLLNYNMFLSAQIMLASMGIPLGTNRINLDNLQNSNPLPALEDNEKTLPRNASINGRMIGGAKNIEELE